MTSSTSIIKHKPVLPDAMSPERRDEVWAGGHMPESDADDSVDALVEEMQLYQEDEDGVEDLDIGKQVNQAEKNRHFDADD